MSTRPNLAARLGRNIAEKRKALGLTQAQIAERLEVDTETVSRFERGVSLPSLPTLERVALTLGTSIADLLDEFPGTAYPAAQRIAASMAGLKKADQMLVAELVEGLSKRLGQS